MFGDIKREATDKFIKIKLFINEINAESSTYLSTSNEFQNTLKGLFFVYLYGVYEMIITKTIGRTIDGLNSSGVHLSDCKLELLSLILSPEYDALYGVGESKKWQRRWDVSQKLIEDKELYISESLFPTDGRNLQRKQLESLYKSFGNTHPVFPRIEIQGYIEELVQNRNFIAHGDVLPQDIGRRYTILELETRLTSIDELCTYFIDSYERYVLDREYLTN